VIQYRSAIKGGRSHGDPGEAGAGDRRRPTLTHGGLSRGAGWYATRAAGAAEYPNARGILPAMGYGDHQIRELEATIDATPADDRR
jgi:hypothetical protein